MRKSKLVEAFNQGLENKAQSKSEATATAKATQASRQKKKSINAFIDPEAAKEFKMLAVETGKTQQELLIEAINELLVKYGKKPLA